MHDDEFDRGLCSRSEKADRYDEAQAAAPGLTALGASLLPLFACGGSGGGNDNEGGADSQEQVLVVRTEAAAPGTAIRRRARQEHATGWKLERFDRGGSTASGTCSTIPEETGGPYPGDGTNGPNALTLSGIVRRDIRTSVGGATGTAGGIELTVKLTVIDAAGCAPLEGYAGIYLALRSLPATTRCIPVPRRTRTTCAACR